MSLLSLKNFMKKINLNFESMNQSDLQRVYNYPRYPRDFKTITDKGFVNIDNESEGGNHCC